jgi:hypothetical protein
MNQRKRARLIAIADGIEEKVQKIPGGIWRKFCPICRREHPQNATTCSRCVETVAAIANGLQEELAARLKKQEEEKSEPKETRDEIEKKILQELRSRLIAAEGRGDAKEARYLSIKYRILRAFKMKEMLDAHVAARQEGVGDPQERARIRKMMYEGLDPEIQEELGLTLAKLPEKAVEVAPSSRRKLEDYMSRAAKRGETLITSPRAARALGFSDIESFVHAAARFGIRPVVDFGTGGISGRVREEVSQKRREEGETASPELDEARPFRYAAWKAKDIVRLRRLMKNRRERAEFQAKIEELERMIAGTDRQLESFRSDMAELDDMEKRAPERLSDIAKARGHLRTQIKAVEQKRLERTRELDALRAKLAETPEITF